MRPLTSALVAVALMAADAAQAGAQAGSLVGRVVTAEGALPLPYAVIVVPSLGRELFTDDRGVFRLTGLREGTIAIRARRMGFKPFEAAFPVHAAPTDTVLVPLERIAVRLATVDVRALPPCRNPGAPAASQDSLTAAVYAQLRLNAQQFELLSRQYPFAYFMERSPSHVNRDGIHVQERVDTVRSVSNAGWAYAPGRVVTRSTERGRRDEHVFNIPTLLDFAGREFVRNHCFHHGGLAQTPQGELVRLDVVAAERIRTPDVEGSIYLDPETFQIRRTVLRLSRMPRVVGMMGMEVTTIFEEVLPSVPVIRSISAVQTFDSRRRNAMRRALEEQRIIGFAWIGRKPGEQAPP